MGESCALCIDQLFRAGCCPVVSGSPVLTHLDDVVEDGVSEVQQRFLVELLAVDDPHLLEEGGLAALPRAQQQDLHQPPHRAPLTPRAMCHRRPSR
uniref:Uncharacterized protein n=1 Tax=Astyanax mexicanus TaxID=7994 RepID=A0A8B9RCQ0_ASTMX